MPIKIDILIPSYKRPLVLEQTLLSIGETLASNKYKITVNVGLQGELDEALPVVQQFDGHLNSLVDLNYIYYSENIGKAECLNSLHNIYCTESDYVLTMDNDMVFYLPWAHMIDTGILLLNETFNLVGFASTKYFIHSPERLEECPQYFYQVNNRMYRVCGVLAVGGGMMLFNNDFFNTFSWSAYGNGVYLGEDDLVCQAAQHFAVLYHDTPWVEHDPYGDKYYPQYKIFKHAQINAGNLVFKPDWDTNPNLERQ